MSRYYDDELYHHGIKGQRWGVRRFQNPDGSLKAAGAKRYGVTVAKNTAAAMRMGVRRDGVTAESVKKNRPSTYSDPFSVLKKRPGVVKKSMAETDSRTGRSKFRTAVSEAKANKQSRDALNNSRYTKATNDFLKNKNPSSDAANKFNRQTEEYTARLKSSRQQYKSDIKSAKQQYKTDQRNARLDRKEARVAKNYDRNIARSEKRDAKLQANRQKNREKLQNDVNYNKLIGDTQGLDRAKARQKDFDLGTEAVKSGQKQYNDTIRNYRDFRVQAVRNPAVKKTPEYKAARKAYSKQKIHDALYSGDSYTKLTYAQKHAREMVKNA